MTVLRWVLSTLMLAIGAAVAAANGWTAVRTHLLKKPWRSSIFLVGGLAGAAGLLALPLEPAHRFAWVPLVLDFGSLPLLLVACVGLLRRRGDGAPPAP